MASRVIRSASVVSNMRNSGNNPHLPLVPSLSPRNSASFSIDNNDQDLPIEFRASHYYNEAMDPTPQTSIVFRKHGKCSTLPNQHHHSHRDREGPTGIDPMNFSPEDLASQLTLLDLPVFKSIQPEELMSCSWNKKNKLEIAPNVVGFIKRFNYVSFWTVQEILRHESVKQRAEMMGHFIRVAKKLHELENLNSQFAVLSALQSAAIYRLSKTWSRLSRKERQSFEKQVELFSERDNFSRLRQHMNDIAFKNQPCIPYLGLYLTDLIYIDMAHPHSGGLESQQRQFKMNNILRIVSELQQSSYSDLAELPICQNYLRSIRYIDELQKFIEDDHYKISLKLEPNNVSAPSSSSSKESVISGTVKNPSSRDPTLMAELNLSPAKNNGLSKSGKNPFVPGHRKTKSEGANIFLSCSGGGGCGAQDDLPSWASGTISSGESDERFKTHLLDDSLYEDPYNPPSKNCSSDNLASEKNEKIKLPNPKKVGDILDSNGGTQCSFQGCIKRKTLIKEGRRPTISGWQRYWLQIWENSLVFFTPKSLTKGMERKDFRSEPSKYQIISGWLVMVADSTVDHLSFQLTDPVRKTVYRFRAPTPELARTWVEYLSRSVRHYQIQSPPANLISFE